METLYALILNGLVLCFPAVLLNLAVLLLLPMLAALNIADELVALRARYTALAGSLGETATNMRSRAGTLAGMLDEVLEDRRAG